MKVYFFPGLAADGTLAGFTRLPGLDVEWIQWPAGIPSEWPEFERKVLGENRFEPDSVFVGISFGGMAALRLAARARARGVILIGSQRRARSLSFLMRALGALVPFTPAFCFNAAFVPRRAIAWLFGVPQMEVVDALLLMARKFPPSDVKALCLLALRFQTTDPGCPVYSIHGAKDRMIRADAEPRDRILADGGHLVCATHPAEVNAALMGWIEALPPRSGFAE